MLRALLPVAQLSSHSSAFAGEHSENLGGSHVQVHGDLDSAVPQQETAAQSVS